MKAKLGHYREFVEVVFQVLMAHCSLMSSQNPALQQRRDPVHARHQFRRGFLLALQEGYFMRVASPSERIVVDPPVGMHGAAWAAQAGSGLIIHGAAIVAGAMKTVVWLKSGTVSAVPYAVTTHIVTAAGREDERSLRVLIQQR